MSENPAAGISESEASPSWQPLGAIDRRVAGVLVEKAKTTPAGYPMSLNGVCTACNQKSNRSPAMNLEPEDVEESLDRLRQLGAVGMVEGSGRVTKFRHYLYDWLGTDKVELAVMAELLLRGTQTVGELRGRVSRMEPVRDLAALRPLVESLKSKGLVVSLTPEGRGHVVTHALYQPRELERIQSQYRAASVATTANAEPANTEPANTELASPAVTPKPREAAPTAPPDTQIADALRRQVEELRGQVVQLRSDLEDLTTRQGETDNQLRDLRDALGE